MSKNVQVKKSIDKEEVKRLYFEEHLTQVAIAKIFEVSKQKINAILKTFSKTTEKEYKHEKSVQNKKDYNKEYLKTYKRAKSTDTEEYYVLQSQLNENSKRLSTYSQMNDYAFVQSNSSIYQTDEKGNKTVIKSMKLKITNDVPKFIPALKIALLTHGHHI